MFRVLLPVLGPTGPAVLAHLLQDLPGHPAPGVGQLFHLASSSLASEMPQLSQCGGAAPSWRRRPAHQCVSAGHHRESRRETVSLGSNTFALSLGLHRSLACLFVRLLSQYQSDSEPRPPSCPEHHRQPLNMYCIQDRQLICGLCLTVGQHQGHPIDDLQAAFIREKQTPSRLLARLSESRWAQVLNTRQS